MKSKTNWKEAVKPLLKKYKGKKHPLEYGNLYELLVMVILAAQTSDKNINSIAPKLFEAYPDMNALSHAKENDIKQFIKGVRNFGNKSQWLMKLSKIVREDKNIPVTMKGLTALPGIGRKSANVILRAAGAKPEGVIVDLHVIRVALRLGISIGKTPDKIESEIIDVIPQREWDQIGMAFSFLGREICRPTNPKCEECVMNPVCAYYNSNRKTKSRTTNEKKGNSFSAKIQIIGINPYVILPADILNKIFLDAAKSKGPIPVHGTINGNKYIQTLVKYKGKWRLYLNTPMRKASVLTVGDMAEVTIEYDPRPRIETMHPEFKAALLKNKIANAAYESLNPSRKKEINRYLNSLKTSEAVKRNIGKVIRTILV
jgi:endonuclease-3